MDQVTFAALTSLILLGKFADFLLTSPIVQTSETLRNGLSREPYVHAALRGANRYLKAVFGDYTISVNRRPIVNVVRLWRVLLISAFLVQGAFLFSTLIVPEMWSANSAAFPFIGVTVTLLLLILVNAIFDVVAIALIILFLDRTLLIDRKSSTWDVVVYASILGVLIAVFYVIVVTTMNLSFSLILHLQGIIAGYETLFGFERGLEMQMRILAVETEWRLLDPIGEGAFIGLNGVNLLVFCLTPLLAPILLAVVALAGAILGIGDAVTDGRVGTLFDGLTQDRRPFFLKLASVGAVAGAGAATLANALT